MHSVLRRYTLKAAGESGQGVNSVGEILAKSLKESGLYTFGYREYPSLIKGGFASHQIDISDQPLNSPSLQTDMLMCMSRVSFHAYLYSVRDHGCILHNLRQLEILPEEQEWLSKHSITVTYVPAEAMAVESGGKALMANVVLIGVMWQLVGLSLDAVKAVLRQEFAKKPEFIEPNLACLERGFKEKVAEIAPVSLPFKLDLSREHDALLSGNAILSLGGIAAGVRAYFSYPMTPASTILSFFAQTYHQTGILVKQIEDEISVAQMAIGSMFVGTRALVGTSGGGFDLMTESLTLAAMTETPFVCILGQRPGPATGLPTWTAAADLNLAVYAGHGEYSRCVIALSDAESCFTLIQKAFNIAEEFQTVVIVLTEKQIAESLFQLPELPASEPIKRGLVPSEQLASLQSTDRYKTTPSGVSPRWLPGQSDTVYDGNGDEHLADGSLTEDGEKVKEIYDKRLRKQDSILAILPEPVIIGPPTAAVSLVGWGSTKNTILDVLEVWNQSHPDQTFNYLHYEYIFPLRTAIFTQFVTNAQQVVLIENNALGQLGALLTQHTGYQFTERWLKYDGRGFFVEDIFQYLETFFKNN